jgi:hypothetical protein
MANTTATTTNETRIIIKLGVEYHERDEDEDCAPQLKYNPPVIVLNKQDPYSMIECLLNDLEQRYDIIRVTWIDERTLRIDMVMNQFAKDDEDDENELKKEITEMINDFPLADTVYESTGNNGWVWFHEEEEYALTIIKDVTFITNKELNYYRKKYGAKINN